MNYSDVIRQAIRNKSARDYPTSSDSRSRAGTVFPAFKPKWPVRFASDQMIFTIGSCFARNIEEALFEKKVVFPTRSFSVPKEEWPTRPNGLLNEYNPGTISQRILYALKGQPFPEATIVPNGEVYADLLLPGGSDVTLERAIERRQQIDAVYDNLANSNCVIITLGFVEAWFDEETKLFLNRAPPHRFGDKHSSRFVLKRLDVHDCMPMLEEAVDALEHHRIKAIMTVSPVPLNTTFLLLDCVMANEFSKAVLRVCAERLSYRAGVDYFPSYEIARSSGMPGYIEDQIHVRPELVTEITKYMIDLYENAGQPGQ